MKRKNTATLNWFASGVALLVLGACVTARAQTAQPESPEPVQPQAPQTQNPQANLFSELGPLGLTQDQVRKIRMINAELKDERQAAGLQLRQAQRALNEAIESPTPNESLIAQRSREVAEAQAHTIRLRSLTEARVLQVLTPEQRARIREIRQRNQAAQGARQQQRVNNVNRQALQGNSNTPVLTPAQRRALRKTPKP